MNRFGVTPLERYRFEGVDFYLKRDDLIDTDFSGNKARKFAYYLDHDFPDIRKVVSYGSAQSNAMYSLSVLAKLRGWAFDYYVDHIASYLKSNPHGSYLAALQNGMRIIEGRMPDGFGSDVLVIEEGGRGREAAWGIRRLADELRGQLADDKIDIFLPSGTGTTAFFLQQFLPNRVVTTPCVGDGEYLQKQFHMLCEGRPFRSPVILESAKKYHFGKLYPQFFKIWVELSRQTGVTFDLLYDPKGWLVLLEHRQMLSEPVCYLHQGGILGNESMLRRYRRKYG